jgi:hypothetical protein
MSSNAATSPAPHRCHAQHCPTEVPPQLFMCRKHWSMVPLALRASIKQTFRPGHEVDKNPSAEYLAFATAAIAEVAHKEARRRGRTPRPPKKPVQLALF